MANLNIINTSNLDARYTTPAQVNADISAATASLAPLNSPALTGSPTVNGTAVATTADVSAVTLGGPTTTLTYAGTLAGGKANAVDATSASFTATLPTPSATGQLLSVEKIDSTVNTVTVSGTIRGAAGTLTLNWQYQSILFEAESTSSWRPVAGHITKTSLDAAYAPIGPRQEVLVYSSGSYPARPSSTLSPNGWVCYIGSAAPTDALTNDQWIDIS